MLESLPPELNFPACRSGAICPTIVGLCLLDLKSSCGINLFSAFCLAGFLLLLIIFFVFYLLLFMSYRRSLFN